ncbi:histidine kinase dimerization/phosphoacceptor domain -containing protein [Candidatus Magnetobacterium casense]|uniref:PAS domain S-box protein n=1 Tax=Candidatus Magnetobacterium casense TaxID=1455061 RepID=A0ABS6RWR7_9BACT|nr:histidine kinase dimerization/phosphoacceptor domain -containing protein [Candidatus Magnetobacterium casensis]MBV6341070.1 PAS domain S-box protein [Candidatus Magnetobacterium casensis]
MMKSVRLITALLSFMSVLLAGIGLLGLHGMGTTRDGLKTVYLDRVVPLRDIKTISDIYAHDIVITLQKVHDGKITWQQAIQGIEKSIELKDSKWKEYKETYLVQEEKRLIAEIEPLFKTADEMVARLLDILRKEDRQALNKYVTGQMYDVTDPVSIKLNELEDVQLMVTRQEYDKAVVAYKRNRGLLAGGVLSGILLAVLGGMRIITGITRPLEETIAERKSVEEALKKSEQERDKFFNESFSLICIASTDGYLKQVNPMFEKVLGFTTEELLSRPLMEFIHPDDRKSTIAEIEKQLGGLTTRDFENHYICKDGSFRILSWMAGPVLEDGRIYAIARDVTRQRRLEEEVRIERDKLLSIMATVDDGIYITTSDCVLEYVNPFVEREFGIAVGRKCYEYFHDKPEPCPWCKKNEILAGKTIYWEWYYPRNGKTYHRYDTPIKNRDGSMSKFALFHDITELKNAEKLIQRSLKEKEMLIAEIHHRVKNNLTIVSSLLKMQGYSIRDKEALNVFREAENRIKSIAYVHEMLYRSDDLTGVDFNSYISKLIKTLCDSYKLNLSHITFNLDVRKVSLGIDIAVPIGLLINELLTNAVKYAFPNGRQGEIFICLQDNSGGNIELIVRDNGVGIPKEIDIRNTESMGFQLITGLAETQLGGKIELNTAGGTEIKVQFQAPDKGAS